MTVWVVSWCDRVEKIFTTQVAAEQYVNGRDSIEIEEWVVEV